MQKGFWSQYGLPFAAVIVGIVLYYSGMLPERNAGAIMAGAAALLPAPYAGMALAAIAPRGIPRLAIYAVTFGAGLIAIVPVYFAAFPGDPIYQGEVSDEQKSASIGHIGAGAYTLTVDGALPERDGDVSLEYRLKVASGDVIRTLDGKLYRNLDRVRVGRRGSAVEEHKRTHERHDLTLPEGAGEVTLVKTSAALAGGLRFQFHKAVVPPALFWGLGVLLFALAAYLEAKYGTEKTRSLLTTSLGFCLFFAYMFPDQVNGDAFVRPAFGSAVLALFVGIFVGGLTSVIVRRLVKNQHAPTPARA
jgi:hypothetical protein